MLQFVVEGSTSSNVDCKLTVELSPLPQLSPSPLLHLFEACGQPLLLPRSSEASTVIFSTVGVKYNFFSILIQILIVQSLSPNAVCQHCVWLLFPQMQHDDLPEILKGAAIVSRPWRADKDYKKSCYSFTLISLVIFGLFPLFEESHARPLSGYFLHLFVRGVRRRGKVMYFKGLKIANTDLMVHFYQKKSVCGKKKVAIYFVDSECFSYFCSIDIKSLVAPFTKRCNYFFAHFIGVLAGCQPSDGHDRRLCVFPVLPLAVWGMFCVES